jgi:hypothetical protein
MQRSAHTDRLIRENLELHRQLSISKAFLQKCYHSNCAAKGITAPTEHEWEDIFDMLDEVGPRKGFSPRQLTFLS